MRVKVPVLIKDPEVSRYKDLPLVEDFVVEQEERFLDGPVSRRLAILDFDADAGGLRAGARFVPPGAGASVFGRYDVASRSELDADDFIQASTFGGVLKTLYLFEEPDTLGRAVRWAFDGSQLLVVPRAGEWGNAFYERESRSLQLFYVKPDSRSHHFYACHSMDILAHETAHAVLDGIAPDLYDSLLPESLALHEAVADLTTLLMAFSSRKLAEHVLEQTGGSITTPSAFTEIAEQFGAAIHPGQEGLRNLFNNRTMRNVDTGEPHALKARCCRGRSTASWCGFTSSSRTRARTRASAPRRSSCRPRWPAGSRPRRNPRRPSRPAASWPAGTRPPPRARPPCARCGSPPSGSSGWCSARWDYPPPGEATFADYGRAIIASDQASHPDSGQQREWLKAEFVKRGIVGEKKELEVKTNYRHPAVAGLDLEELVRERLARLRVRESARQSLLAIPPSIPFKVEPRLDVTKTYYHRARTVQSVRECLFKVSWTETEPNAAGPAGIPRRQLRRGTTLAIDWATRNVRAVVTTGSRTAAARASERRARDGMLVRLTAGEELRIGPEAYGPYGKLLRGSVPAEIVGDTLEVRGVARTLHVTRGV